MSYSLREINQQIRTDPQDFAQRSDAVYTEKVRKAAQKIAARRRESHIVLLSFVSLVKPQADHSNPSLSGGAHSL